VISDQIVWLGCESKRGELEQPLRIVKIACTPHRKRSGHTGRGGPEQGAFLLVATNLMDLPAEVIALIYRKRWTVELFFRFYKHVLGCRHLISHRPNGIEIQVYLAIIVCMLIVLWTHRSPIPARRDDGGNDPLLFHRVGRRRRAGRARRQTASREKLTRPGIEPPEVVVLHAAR